LDPDKVNRDPRYPTHFYVEISLSDYCRCNYTIPFENRCKDCSVFMKEVRKDWETIYSIMKDYKRHSLEDSKILLFGDPDFDDFNEILYTRRIILNQ
jgi:phosphatidylinositol-3,4,5-trisphosphate 3-phosphatase and dual-specificity protein phosphatase PTEN